MGACSALSWALPTEIRPWTRSIPSTRSPEARTWTSTPKVRTWGWICGPYWKISQSFFTFFQSIDRLNCCKISSISFSKRFLLVWTQDWCPATPVTLLEIGNRKVRWTMLDYSRPAIALRGAGIHTIDLLAEFMTCFQTVLFTIDRLIDWLDGAFWIVRLIDWLADFWVDWLIDWLVDRLADFCVDWLIDWLIGLCSMVFLSVTSQVPITRTCSSTTCPQSMATPSSSSCFPVSASYFLPVYSLINKLGFPSASVRNYTQLAFDCSHMSHFLIRIFHHFWKQSVLC